MKRCAQCHGRLGLGVRFRNIWNGHWWVHLRFCSTQCERLYELYETEASARDRWYSFLASRGRLLEAMDRVTSPPPGQGVRFRAQLLSPVAGYIRRSDHSRGQLEA
jgi:hypothetical protein